METKKGTYHFKITSGEFLTSTMREMWLDNDKISAAIDLGMEGLGMTYEQTFQVCTGKKKIVETGIDDLMTLEDDDSKKWNGVDIPKRENMDIDKIEIKDFQY